MKGEAGGRPYLSIIIPVLNEEANIAATLLSTQSDMGVERVVVDGGSADNTRAIAGNAVGVKVVLSIPGRAMQLNRGAAEAKGEILLFLHGDTRLPPDYVNIVRQTMDRTDCVAGAFSLAIDSPQKCLQWVAAAATLRSRWMGFPYGDQAIFLRAGLFRELGGFVDVPVMEDFALVQQLRRRGRIHILDQQVVTSARRWQRLGVFRTTCVNQMMVLGYLFGLPLDFLAKFYGVVHKS